MRRPDDHTGLNPAALLAAYASGCFPMDDPGARGPVGLYEAEPRAIIPVEAFRVPRSVARARRRAGYRIRVDAAFREVLEACAEGRSGIWLTPRLIDAYERLHRMGQAHTVEAWRGGRLCGGLFGVALGGLFTSESMFHRESDAGSVALAGAGDLVRDGGFVLWDIQMASSHTVRFGAVEIGRDEYRARLRRALAVDAWLPEPGSRD